MGGARGTREEVLPTGARFDWQWQDGNNGIKAAINCRPGLETVMSVPFVFSPGRL